MGQTGDINVRAAVFAALGEPARLIIVDRLVTGDVSPGELASESGIGTNLMAHHLRVLEEAGVIRRIRSEGDRRRSYVTLCMDNPIVWAAAVSAQLAPWGDSAPARVLFVCTANSARSQLAAARWNQLSAIPATSAGTHPGPAIHQRAIRAGRRHGLHLDGLKPMGLADVLQEGDVVVVVCDKAHEELDPAFSRLHWSVPDPVRVGTDAAFENAYSEIDGRIERLVAWQQGRRRQVS